MAYDRLNKILESITNLVEDRVADQFIFNTSAIGTNFLRLDKSSIVDYLNDGRINLKLHSAKESLKFLATHSHTGAGPLVLDEFEAKRRLTNNLIICYEKHLKSSAERQEGEIAILQQIAKEETKIRYLLLERLHNSRNGIDMDLLHQCKKRVISANPGPRESLYDEGILGEAIYQAFSKNNHVALVTGDTRFRKIMVMTQRSLQTNRAFKELHDFLMTGKLSIILLEMERPDAQEGYKVDYCSEDFARPEYH